MVFDDVVVCWWRDERVLNGAYCDPGARRENSQRAFLIAHSRRRSYRRRLVADAAYVLFRARADIRGVLKASADKEMPSASTPSASIGRARQHRRWHNRPHGSDVSSCEVIC